ncbi:hypothetical protein [Symbioplanes lichenis]|uniref:hypothetical protein n=1 Tax=Symbioplanes lichenis TaxID=1629072 RepID=UPI0027394091|nr:hypothetical protein [Actinoplanes lichenis]
MPDRKAKTQRTIHHSAEQELAAAEDRLIFSFRYADHGYRGAWAWPRAAEAEEVLNFFCHIGSSTWNEVKGQMTGSRSGSHRKHHEQHVEHLCSEAQQRLVALKHTHKFGTTIFRFRVGGRKRLWGFVNHGVFYVVWWDAEHQVYPIAKK